MSNEEFYSVLARNCETEMERFLPGYTNEMIPIMLNEMQCRENATALDLCCGVGNIAEKLLLDSQVKHLDCVDVAPDMLHVCQSRLSECSGRVSYYESDALKFEPRQKYDRILSSIALHNVSNGEKPDLIRKIHSWLNRNGRFVWSDLTHFDDPHIQKQQVEYRRRIALGLGATEDFADRNFAKEAADPTLTAAQMREMLSEAGFTNIQQLWQRTLFAVFSAEK